MSDDFFKTRMGHRFYESTMPQLVEQLARLNTNMEALIALLQKLEAPAAQPPRAASSVEPR
ncbi:MAG TPA: hypothetical protein VHC69_27990 [Polyangiaceae bacterium]|nr:hypothetical protein [Polyangiaceae bacterium]